jgi:protein involved in polysaccharide export with SLBB domain
VAQEFRRFDNINVQGTAYRVFAQQGEATVQVLVIGNVPSPGLYEIGVGIALDQLLALTGGTTLAASTSSRTRVTVRLYRFEGASRQLAYEAPIEQLLAEPERYPPLQDGDVVTVETFTVERNRLNWQDAVNLIAGAATIILLVERFAQ